MTKHKIDLSDGTSYIPFLDVYRDYIEARGAWRLFWRKPGSSCGVHEQSTVTGQPFFRTKSAAVAYAERRYGIRPMRGHGYIGDIE